jgi:hypothetical protein
MQNAEAIQAESAAEDVRFKVLENEFKNLYSTLSLESFFQTLEEFIDRSRKSLESVNDPAERERLRKKYRGVIEFAMDMALGLE